MKKIAFVMMAVMLSGAAVSHAAQTASYDEMKEIKARQRQEREAKKTAMQSGTYEETKMQKFWRNEGERSGLGNAGGRAGNFFRGLNPGPFFSRQKEAYEARKTSGGVK